MIAKAKRAVVVLEVPDLEAQVTSFSLQASHLSQQAIVVDAGIIALHVRAEHESVIRQRRRHLPNRRLRSTSPGQVEAAWG